MKQSVERLIHSFRPIKYSLHIDQDAAKLTFLGNLKITGDIPVPSSSIKLHADGLRISSAVIEDLEARVSHEASDQTATLSFPSELSGKVTVKLEFSGKITKPMHGLYPCSFTYGGEEKRLLATQFESHHAREVFPCIDEPEAKAVFELELTTSKDDVVVSNTPIASEKIEGERKTTSFEPTPVMSTYLLAWVSGDLIYEEATTKHGVVVRAYCTPVHAGKTSYGLDVACKALDYMDDYFAIPYPLQKCDILALPDFAAGAMENWGCITFRESAMLIDPEQSDLSDKQHVANVVTHELAHQWFGNLVTMRWWEDLWLNEGFASWVPYLVLNDLFPEWRLWEQFSTGDLMIGMRADALQNTHPIVVEINNPNEIRSAFDSISYDKGCSVIHLLYHYIGADAFRSGLRNYLNEHAYSNAETADLWRAWAKSSGKDVEEFMRSWTTEKGFPIVKANEKDGALALTQERFYLLKPAQPDETIWPIPLMQEDNDTSVLSKKEGTVRLAKLNKGQSGFYRVIYDKKAAASILSKTPEAIDMLGLINDAAEAAKAGYHSTTEALELFSKIRTSTSEPLIGTALGELAGIRSILSATYEDMKPYAAKFIEPNLTRLGIEKRPTDSIDDELMRPMVVGTASYSGNPEVVTWALQTFDNANSPEEIPAEMRGIVYQTIVRESGDTTSYNKLLSWYNTNTIPGEQISLANALTNFKDPELIRRTLDYITSENIKLQDSLYWIAYSLAGRYSKYLAWEWLKSNWGWVGENFGKDKEIDYYLRYAASGFASKEHLADYTAFFESVDIFGSNRAFEQGKETISWQAAWKERDEQKVVDWLNSN